MAWRFFAEEMECSLFTLLVERTHFSCFAWRIWVLAPNSYAKGWEEGAYGKGVLGRVCIRWSE